MLSPFPGVDPYLEAQKLWRDFHGRFIPCWQELLLKQLPERYDARMEQDVYIGKLSESEVRSLVLPDVAVVAGRQSRHRRSEEGGVAVEEEPQLQLKPKMIPHTILEERRIVHLRIRERKTDRLVAVLELLSPTNKWGSGRAKYLRKRRQLRRARVHLVEVDFLMTGQPPPLAMSPPKTHCHVYLTRGNRPRMCEVYSWNLQDPLPTIPIPLLKPDPDLMSNLRTVFNLAYERGQYPRALDYSRPLDLPLDEETLQWAHGVAAQFAKAK